MTRKRDRFGCGLLSGDAEELGAFDTGAPFRRCIVEDSMASWSDSLEGGGMLLRKRYSVYYMTSAPVPPQGSFIQSID